MKLQYFILTILLIIFNVKFSQACKSLFGRGKSAAIGTTGTVNNGDTAKADKESAEIEHNPSGGKHSSGNHLPKKNNNQVRSKEKDKTAPKSTTSLEEHLTNHTSSDKTAPRPSTLAGERATPAHSSSSQLIPRPSTSTGGHETTHPLSNQPQEKSSANDESPDESQYFDAPETMT